MKRTRTEAFALTENTHVLVNNWVYQDERSKEFCNRKVINSWLMTQRNDKQLKEIYGKCSFATNDWEYYTRGWVVEYEGETYIIYSSDKGTSYEIVSHRPNRSCDAFAHDEALGLKMLAFIKQLVEKMRKLEINQENIAEWQKLEDSYKDEENEY